MTQYCAGGIYRWVRLGCQPTKNLSKAERELIEGDQKAAVKHGMGMLSTLSSLKKDRLFLMKRERVWNAR